LVLVNNGSSDGTGHILSALQEQNSRIKLVSLAGNAGYGGGILAGLSECTGRYVGYAWGDDQIRAEDVFRVFDVLRSDGLDLCKTTRIAREDGVERKIVSWIYNTAFELLFPARSRDVNGCPKIMRAEALQAIRPRSRDWFLDAEIMIKAERHGLKVGEVAVTYHRRKWGRSHVGLRTILEFLWNMIRYRVGGL
jgi:glycosyltransferase involved in cell wall biosynthesis